MVEEAKQRAEAALEGQNVPTFEVKDLEDLEGRYHTVICLDVLIHYPQDQVQSMIKHLGSMAESRLILSFAPKTLCYSLLKKVGEFFFLAPVRRLGLTCTARLISSRRWRRAGLKSSAKRMTKTQFLLLQTD